MRFFPLASVLAAFGMMVSARPLSADEGMWLFNAPPLQQLQERYGFRPSAAWLERVQRACIRLNNGGSGSFVSPEGLIVTNHHVTADALYKLSTPENNYARDGFHARTRDAELRCVDLELNVLVSIEDVTTAINAAVDPAMDAATAFTARRAAKEKIEGESLAKTGLRSDVVTLYQGAAFHLYRYKRYTDVRLVFAPELRAAFFGGDPDNYEFPRFCLDAAFLRAYEDGRPAKVEHYLNFQQKGVKDGDLVFVAGHPGSTRRLFTLAELEFQRDVAVPMAATAIKNKEVALRSWSDRSAENARRAQDDLFGLQNGRKVMDGSMNALLTPSLLEGKKADEAALRAFANERADLLEARGAWDRIATAQRKLAALQLRHDLLERYPLDSKLFDIARDIFRAVEERSKASGERLREYRDSNRASLELGLFSEEPIYDDYEQLKLAHSMVGYVEKLGFSDAITQAVLANEAPADRAAAIIGGTRLKDVEYRKKLYAMSPGELAKIDDPMLKIARIIDPDARAVRKQVEELDEVKQQAQALIAKVRYAKHGSTVYPDATFSLRLAFGRVKGYEENSQQVPAFTTIGGMFARSDSHERRVPFDLPPSWAEAKSRLNLETPYNFVSTAESVGGNSGSPVLNRDGEFVGIIFDGNIQSMIAPYAYSEIQARSISVDVRAVLEALKNVYRADALVEELERTGSQR
jgi:hypothetical protein